jgi:hypothetical protein
MSSTILPTNCSVAKSNDTGADVDDDDVDDDDVDDDDDDDDDDDEEEACTDWNAAIISSCSAGGSDAALSQVLKASPSTG